MKTKILLIIVILSTNLIYSQIEFNKHDISPTFTSKKHIRSCDIDNDGDIDIVILNRANIGFFENIDGNGTFADYRLLISDFSYVSTFECEDVDLDGDIDIVTSSGVYNSNTHFTDYNIFWYENINNSFSVNNRHTVTENIWSIYQIKFIDIDADSYNDIVYTGQNSCYKYAIAWQSNISGNFSTQHLVYNDSIRPSIFEVTDINNDQNNDILCGFEDGKINWYDNTSNHNFINSYNLFNGSNKISSLDVGDINNDLKKDIVWYERASLKVRCKFKINDNPLYTNDTVIYKDTILSEFGINIYSSNLYDIDADNDLDLIIFANDTIKWCENNGNLTQAISLCSNSLITETSSINDLNGDNKLDFITYNQSDLGWYNHINGNGLFSNRNIITKFSEGAYSYYSADLDNDGDIDIICVDDNYKIITLFENNGAGEFSNQIILFSAEIANRYNYFEDFKNIIIVKDFDNDDFKDIALSYSNKIVLFKNTGSNLNFEPESVIYQYSSNHSSTIYSSDINNDNLPDIIARYNNGYNLVVLKNSGNGTFDFIQNIYFNSNYLDMGNYGIPIAFNDYDGDGDVDFSSICYNGVYTFENIDGQGDFSNGNQLFSLNSTFSFVFSEDFDSDGDFDILTSNRSTDFLNILINDGSGTFTNQSLINNLDYDPLYNQISVADFDNDNDYDIFLSEPPFDIEGTNMLLLNNGNAVFESKNIICPVFPSYMQTADVNNDSITDIISNRGGELFWLETPEIVSIAIIKNNSNILIYPNPTNGTITIDGKGIEQIEIYNISGILIKTINNKNIDLSKQAKGVYFVKIIAKESTIIKKIILE